MVSTAVHSKAMVLLLLIIASIVGFCLFYCFVVHYFESNISFAIILMGERELVALLCLPGVS